MNPPVVESSATPQWTLILLFTALVLSLVILGQILTTHSRAYFSAPREVATFLEAVDSSIAENESYDRDVVARVPRLEDKRRLARLLSEIQKGGDDLREDLNRLLMGEPAAAAGAAGGGDGDKGRGKLRAGARVLWGSKRGELEERVRRLDILRMRFLVVYLGVITAGVSPGEKSGLSGAGGSVAAAAREDAEKVGLGGGHGAKPALPRALTESITGRKHPPLRRLTTQAMGHNDREVTGGPRKGWAGVMQELQKSPKLHQRHASIEMAMARQPTF